MRTRWWVVVGIALISPLWPDRASAAVWQTCNGVPIDWGHQPTVTRNRCSIPDTGDANQAYWNGVLQWAQLAPLVGSYHSTASNDCSWDNRDGVNEIFLQDPQYMDGALGLSYVRTGTCFLNTPHIEEVDIAIRSSMSFSNPSPTSLGSEGRGTFLHEFGHFFGLLDENDRFGAMHQTPRPYTGGNQSAVPFGTDTQGIAVMYGWNNVRPNMVPSAMKLTGTTIGLHDAPALVQACRGSAQAVHFQLSNAGPATTSNYTVRIRLSTSQSAFGSGGVTAVSGTIAQAAYSSAKVTFNFSVPSTLANGTYRIYVDADPFNERPEVQEGDNSTVSAKLLLVNC